MTAGLAERAAILRAFGAGAATVEELLAYDRGELATAPIDPACRFPLPSESFADTWRRYQARTAASGFLALSDELVQLQFPIEDGISARDDYVAATRQGRSTGTGRGGLRLVDPAAVTARVHATWAGGIPVVQTACRDDFVSLVRAFTSRNEPAPIPHSMGACFVSGYNNWGRFARLKQEWAQDHPGEPFSIGRVAPLKERYQDRFMILSDGPYSDVAAAALGLSASAWRVQSIAIRREHESAHYWTRRVLGSMKKRLIDEVIADYYGILAACGVFRADWFLAFFGLERHPECRRDGRIHNYRGQPPLSDAAFAIVCALVFAAAEHLDRFSRRHAQALSDETGTLLALLTLSRLSLEELASTEGPERLGEQLHHFLLQRGQLCEKCCT
jgi:uncharacterized protein DUF7005